MAKDVNTCLYTVIHGSIRLNMARYGSYTWLNTVKHGNTWLYTATKGDTWLYTVYGYVWLYTARHGSAIEWYT